MDEILSSEGSWCGARAWPPEAAAVLATQTDDARALLAADDPMQRWFLLGHLAGQVTRELLRRQGHALAYRGEGGMLVCRTCAGTFDSPLHPVYAPPFVCEVCWEPIRP